MIICWKFSGSTVELKVEHISPDLQKKTIFAETDSLNTEELET